MEERESTVIQWGGLGYQQKYVKLLRRRYIVGWITALLFLLGTIGLLGWPHSTANPDQPSFPIWMGLAFTAFIIVILLAAGVMQSIDRRLRSIEVFLDFYDRRSEVRHEIFCRHHLHCLAVHYSTPGRKGPDREHRSQ